MITSLGWLANLATGWAIFGLIWTIQLVHYPSFRYVPDFTDFHAHHTSSITLVVGPLMVAELAAVSWAVYQSGFSWVWVIPFVTVVAIWALTFFWAVPLHESLATNRDDATIEALIAANWPRTLLWTLKAVWVSILFLRA